MKKIIIALLAFLFTVMIVNAQDEQPTSSDYKTAIGFKFPPTGITVKHFLTGSGAVEGLAYFLNYGLKLTGLYEIHRDINSIAGLKWYIGPGMHIAFYNANNGNGSAIGIDGVLGLDYKISSIPINVSLDWEPSIEFGNGRNNGFTGNWGGVGVRYTF